MQWSEGNTAVCCEDVTAGVTLDVVIYGKSVAGQNPQAGPGADDPCMPKGGKYCNRSFCQLHRCRHRRFGIKPGIFIGIADHDAATAGLANAAEGKGEKGFDPFGDQKLTLLGYQGNRFAQF
jgi:hypothetical protein